MESINGTNDIDYQQAILEKYGGEVAALYVGWYKVTLHMIFLSPQNLIENGRQADDFWRTIQII
jgi:hypothetical protein